MNWKILNKSPLADSRKCSVTAAAITAGATLAGSGISAASVAGHSHQNRVLARWQTEKQYQLAQEQMAAQKEMYHHSIQEQRYIDERNRQWQLADVESERAYNDPKAVAARLKAAGINPALAMQGGAGSMLAGSGYNSPSMPSPSSAPTGSVSASVTPVMPPETRPYDIGAGVSQAVQDFMSMLGLESDVQRKNIQNANDTALTQANINKLFKDGLLSDQQRDNLLNDLNEARQTFEERSKGYQLQNDEINSRIQLNSIKTIQSFVEMDIEQKKFDIYKGLSEAELNEVRASANKLFVEASELVQNGVSGRKLNDALEAKAKEEKRESFSRGRLARAQAKHQENQNVIDQPEVDKSRKTQEAYKSSRVYRAIDYTVDHIVDKFASLFKYFK